MTGFACRLSLVFALFACLMAPAAPAAAQRRAAPAARARVWKAPADVRSNPPVTGVRRTVGLAVLRSANHDLQRSEQIGARASRRGDRASELRQQASSMTGPARTLRLIAAKAAGFGETAGLVRATIVGRRSERNARRASRLLNDPSILTPPVE